MFWVRHKINTKLIRLLKNQKSFYNHFKKMLKASGDSLKSCKKQ